MADKLVISIDAMGGDKAPEIVIEGLRLALLKNPDVFFLLFGDERRLTPLCRQAKLDETCYRIYHTEQVVSGDEKPSHAVRYGRESSMWKAIYAVRRGEASAVVSAGNTGALMAMSKIILGTIAGVDRPAIAAVMPTCQKGKDVLMLDMGANTECNATNLVEFAMMGTVFYQLLFKNEKPTVGLLNIGSEETKGREEIREAAMILKNNGDKVNYMGFVEGNDILKGDASVVVSDGFSGNVALKSIEGTAHLVKSMVKQALKRSFVSKLGLLLALPMFRKIKKRIDPRRYNGAMFLGLNGISVKSHGGSDAVGYSYAVTTAINLAKNNLCEKIKTCMEEVVFSPDEVTEE